MNTILWLTIIVITSFSLLAESNNQVDYKEISDKKIRLCRFIQTIGTICVFVFPPDIWKNAMLDRFGEVRFFWYYLCNIIFFFFFFLLSVGLWYLVIYILNINEKDFIHLLFMDKK